ncbi:phage portal protein [Micromonospora sp. C51]|uniref:phage portal protein n=1 Tax=Micromonospora sp. C51 TaxID=2824879 RepID=UPI001B35B9D7|nr:phage portal protein [Micromonospora sp. C51]MBQ1047871.1 phage portal protein [Micromonospora sp. C51]
MAIDVSQRRSPGWWMQRLMNQLADRRRRNRLRLLYDFGRGEAPLPDGLEAARESFRIFLKQSRSNFAGLIVGAVTERMTPTGFRTAVDADETGDAEAAALWRRAGMDVRSSDVHKLMLTMGEAYVVVGDIDEETGAPIITAEDPQSMVGEPDPTIPWRLQAALKVLHDDVDGVDRAYLYMPGRVFVAKRRNEHNAGALLMAFDPRTWEWDTERGGPDGQVLPHSRMPVVRFTNEDEMGEFEPHLDLLSRINNVILHRMTISTLQAYRQRAIRGVPTVYPKDHPKAGQQIDYSQVFSMDPAALWLLPASAEIWESGQVNLDGILNEAKDDIQQLAAVSRTPMHTFMPSGANQSAEGAMLQREGLVFKVEDRITRTSHPWAWVMSLAFQQLRQVDRADLAKLQVLWRSPQRLSLSERADAASKGQDIPWRTRMADIWGYSPGDIDRMASERADEMLFEAQLAAQIAALQGSELAPQGPPGLQARRQQPTPAAAVTMPQVPTPADPLATPLQGLPTVAS